MNLQALMCQTPKPSNPMYARYKSSRNQTDPNSSVNTPINTHIPIWQRKQSDCSHAHISTYKKMRSSILGVLGNRNQSEEKIQTAVDILLRGTKQKVGEVTKFISKKRDMMLMQMKIDEKQNKIEDLQFQLKNKKDKLKDTDSFIKQDLKIFNGFIKDSKNNTKEMLKQTQDAVKTKEDTMNYLENLKEKRLALTVTNTKKIDYIKQLLVYKNFVETLASMKIEKQNINMGISSINDVDIDNRLTSNLWNEKEFNKCYNTILDEDFINEVKFAGKGCNLEIQSACNVDELLKQMQDENLRILHDTQIKLSTIAISEATLEQLQQEFETKVSELNRQRDCIEESIHQSISKLNLLMKVEVAGKERIEKLSELFIRKIKPITFMLVGSNNLTIDNHLELIEMRVLNDSEAITKFPEDQIRKYERILFDNSKVKYIKEMAEKERTLLDLKKQKLFKNDFIKRKERKHNFRRYININNSPNDLVANAITQDENERYFN